MTEQLAVDGAFGNGTAVDGKVFLALSGRIVVNHLGDNLLAHTTFAHDKHAHIGGRHL